jgi:hypothetical protein
VKSAYRFSGDNELYNNPYLFYFIYFYRKFLREYGNLLVICVGVCACENMTILLFCGSDLSSGPRGEGAPRG